MNAQAVVVLVTGPDTNTLLDLGRRLVEERLAACVNVFPTVTSVYRWEGEVNAEPEALAVIKSTAGRTAELERRTIELHPYDVPEFVILPVTGGSRAYLDWLATSVGERSGDAES
jgi:periplasmic divalent cation tolerance protein